MRPTYGRPKRKAFNLSLDPTLVANVILELQRNAVPPNLSRHIETLLVEDLQRKGRLP